LPLIIEGVVRCFFIGVDYNITIKVVKGKTLCLFLLTGYALPADKLTLTSVRIGQRFVPISKKFRAVNFLLAKCFNPVIIFNTAAKVTS